MFRFINKRLFPKRWGVLSYRCNICGRSCKTPISELERETPTCFCKSTVRSRSIIHMLSLELFGESLALPNFPVRRDIFGWGMSDAGYTNMLSNKINYVNTFYHKEPRLDITAPLNREDEGKLDFLISSEVFEHINPPVSIAFENAHRLLKPNGVFVFTAPFTLSERTKEHFPDIYQYDLIKQSDGNITLKNITKDGEVQIFDDLVFHGGVGTTLEMRVFSKDGIIKELESAGFYNIKFYSQPCWEFGIYWRHPWSLPLTARLS